MKKLLLFLSFFMIGSFGAAQAAERQKGFELDVKGYLASCGAIYALNLGVIGYTTGSVDLLDMLAASYSAAFASADFICPPKTEQDAIIRMGMQVVVGGLMLGRIWYKIANRPRPAPGGQ